jgi:HD domain-containing protein
MVMAERRSSPVEGRWRARPILSGLLRAGIFTVPIVSALAATWLARSMLAAPSDRAGWVFWWALLLTLGVVVAMAVERVARRLMPLAMLLKLSMLFPERAPSRFRVARKAGNLRHLESLQTRADDAGDSATKILALVTALSAHDRHTRGHAERVRVFTDMLSEELELPERDRYRLRWAALLHDIGKLSVDPAVLNKPAKLSDEEWTRIREHPNEGMRLAGPLVEWLGPWGQAIAHHHERVDGTGYPAGFAGEEISYGGRIVAVADAYDTMTSVRSYQKPKATAAARRELVEHAGTQFDASVVRAFLAISLPRLVWATGPISLAVHLPFLAQLQQIGQASIAATAQTATVTAMAGVTAMGLMGPAAAARANHHVGRLRPNVEVQASAAVQSTSVPTAAGVAPEGQVPPGRAGKGERAKAPEAASARGSSQGSGSNGQAPTPRGESSGEGSRSGHGHGHARGHDKGSDSGNGHVHGHDMRLIRGPNTIQRVFLLLGITNTFDYVDD